MLPSLSQTTSNATRRTLLFLGAMAVAALALPTIKRATHAQSADLGIVIADDTAERKRPEKASGVDRLENPGTATKSKDIAVEIEYLPRPSKFEEQVLAALGKQTDVEFSDLALEDCLAFIHEATDLPIWIDKQTLQDEGVALDQKVTLKLKGARLESVLNLLLTPAQLAYLPDNDVLMITTATKAGDNLITRTYPVSDILGRYNAPVAEPAQKNDKADAGAAAGPGVANIESHSSNERARAVSANRQVVATSPGRNVEVQLAQGFVGDRGQLGGGGGGGRGGMAGRGRAGQVDFTSLMNLISTTIQPDSWEDLCGPGSMMPYRKTLSLVVRQAWPVHRQILQLLRDLREAKRLAPDETALTPAGDTKK